MEIAVVAAGIGVVVTLVYLVLAGIGLRRLREIRDALTRRGG